MKKKFLIFLIIILIIVILPILIYFFLNSRQENQIYVDELKSRETLEVKDVQKISKLDKIVDENFSNDTNYSVVVKNFNTEEAYSFNEDREYNSASLYKLWVFAVAMQMIKDEVINPDEIMSGDKNKFDEMLGIETAEVSLENASEENEAIEPIYISMKISNAIEKMITESDNYAALLLTQKVGYKNVDFFLEENRFDNSSFGSPPKTTAGDMASFYEKLYKGEIVNKSISADMLNILKRQTWNDRIPKYLPEDIEVAHKTGELFGAKHDAGIVFSKNGDYMIIVLSQTDNESIAAEKIAKFSGDIFNYFNSVN